MARAVAALLTASLLAALSLGAASATPLGAVSASKTCSPGYVHANLSWGEKCLRAGEFCKVGNTEYRAYGFTCPASGHLQESGPITTPPATTTPAITPDPDQASGSACGIE